MQYSKREGGLGFRDLAKFNDALLAKQAWRLIHQPNTLFSRIMKARYFPEDSILDAKIRKSQSYGWASLLVGIQLLKQGTRYIVGDGTQTRIDCDNVLPSHPPRPVRSLNSSMMELPLSSLISSFGQHRFWDITKIQETIDPEDHSLLSNIYLSRVISSDRLFWSYTKTGDYTVRSGYWFLTHNPNQVHTLPPIPYGSIELKNRIWKLPLLPKIKHFLWRVLSRALATATGLCRRGILQDSSCSQCRNGDETINHVLFICPFANTIWQLSNALPSDLRFSPTDLEENISTILHLFGLPSSTRETQFLPFWILWRIWKARNHFVFNKVRESPSKIVLKAKAEMQEWLTTIIPPSPDHDTPRSLLSLWSRPNDPFVKCNFDARFDVASNQIIGGWIIRDHHGVAKYWGASNLHASANSLEAETKALLVAMQQTWIRGFSNVLFEGDCEELINIVNDLSSDLTISSLVCDIRFWMSKFTAPRVLFVRRSCNGAAHKLAKFGCLHSDFYSSSLCPPDWLDKQLYHDYVNSI